MRNKRTSKGFAAKGFAILVAVLMAFVMMPLGTGLSHAATGTVKAPLDFAKDTKTRSGAGWSWDGTEHVLYLDNFQMDLTKYDKSYTAAIQLPAGKDGAKIVLSGTNEITLKGSSRCGIAAKGDLHIEGGILNINANGKTNGIHAKKNLSVKDGTLGVYAYDYSIQANETMTLEGTTLDLSLKGANTGKNAIKTAILVQNSKVVPDGMTIQNSDITAVIGGKNSCGLALLDQKLTMEDSSYNLTVMDSAEDVEGLDVNNGDAFIKNSQVYIDVKTKHAGDESLIMNVGTWTSKHPAPNPTIEFVHSNVRGFSSGTGLSAYYQGGGIGIVEQSVVDIEAAYFAADTGVKSLQVADSSATFTADYNFMMAALRMDGPACFSNSEVKAINTGEDGIGMIFISIDGDEYAGEDPLTVRGENTVLTAEGTQAAFEYNADTLIREDAAVVYEDGLTPVEGGTLQRVLEITPNNPDNYGWSFSEGDLGYNDTDFINASQKVVIAKPNGPVIIRQPQPARVCYPEDATFTVELWNPANVASYQWYKVDTAGTVTPVETASATTAELTIPTAKADDHSSFYCEIVDKDGKKVTSKKAELRAVTSLSGQVVQLSKETFTYNGKVQKPAVVTIGGEALVEGTDYTIEWPKPAPKNAGLYFLTVNGIGDYGASTQASFVIEKANNPMVAKGKTVTVKYSKLKKRAQTIKRSAAMGISKNKGTLSFEKTDGNAKITVNAASGKIKVAKKLKKGTYPVKVNVTAAGNANYNEKSKIVTVKIKVK